MLTAAQAKIRIKEEYLKLLEYRRFNGDDLSDLNHVIEQITVGISAPELSKLSVQLDVLRAVDDATQALLQSEEYARVAIRVLTSHYLADAGVLEESERLYYGPELGLVM